MKNCINKFVPKSGVFLVLKNKIKDIISQRKFIFKNIFGILSVDEKNDESEQKEPKQVELDNQEYYYGVAENIEEAIQRKVQESEKKEIITIEDEPIDNTKDAIQLAEQEQKEETPIQIPIQEVLLNPNPMLVQVKEYPKLETHVCS